MPRSRVIRIFAVSIAVVACTVLFSGCSRTKPLMPERASADESVSGSVDQSSWSWVTPGGERRSLEKTREILLSTMKTYGVHGLSIFLKQGAFWSNRPNSYSLDLGTENPDSGKPIDGLTVFSAGNLSEPIVAYLALKLATLGKIDIDRPLSRYLVNPPPDDPDWMDLLKDDRSQRLTARRILSHQSGLAYSRAASADRRLHFESTPGKAFGYSKDAYPLLYPVLESITGRTFRDLAKTMVFDPIGMPQSSFGMEPRFKGHVALLPERGDDQQYVFLTSAADFTKFAWLLAITGLDLSFEYSMDYHGFAEISVKTASPEDRSKPGNPRNLPRGLSWFLGWGRYELPRVLLGNCFFIGARQGGVDSYATAFESQNSTALTVLIAGHGNSSMMPRILQAFLGEIETPLAWLEFGSSPAIR